LVNPSPGFSCFFLSSPAPDCLPLGSLHQCRRRWWSSSGEGEPTGNRKKSPLRLRLLLWVAMTSRNRWRRSRTSSSAEKLAGTTGWPAKFGHLQLWHHPAATSKNSLSCIIHTALWIEDGKVLNTF
ncbi:unnamed protein product, partial [Musa hybrid cultivar]